MFAAVLVPGTYRHQDGHGVSQDDSEAVKWFHRAEFCIKEGTLRFTFRGIVQSGYGERRLPLEYLNF
jgi:hypothetical protein